MVSGRPWPKVHEADIGSDFPIETPRPHTPLAFACTGERIASRLRSILMRGAKTGRPRCAG